MNTLQKMLVNQAHLQTVFTGGNPIDLSDSSKMDYLRTMVLALENELHEFLGETGWKPWASSNHVNIDAAKGELVDAWHFFMNLMNLIGLDADELYYRYFEKQQKNRDRQAKGYDGVSEKCPICHRALDDEAVDCTIVKVDVSTPMQNQMQTIVRCYA